MTKKACESNEKVNSITRLLNKILNKILNLHIKHLENTKTAVNLRFIEPPDVVKQVDEDVERMGYSYFEAANFHEECGDR